ncbi:hypothetical protein [Paenibacillus oleatilyticus]|uniref:Restriction endonuclease type IV Mrr domain-containing protein n=1 Tax=Paenibacillus oleatilyticus TaxID=2594886 RepID=A0ABV4V5L8_9BACL
MYQATDTKKLVIEIIATLVHIKSTMYEQILKPAGINKNYFQSLMKRKNDAGKWLTKREIASTIIAAIVNHSNYEKIIYSIIKTASEWNQFHLADNEYEARATVQKAREVLDVLDLWEEKEARQRQQAREKAEKEKYVQKEKELIKQLQLLLLMYDSISGKNEHPQSRGTMLEDIVNRLFNAYDLTEQLTVLQAFRRNNNGEQIDGAFKLDGWHYIVEMKWTSQVSGIRELDSLLGKVSRSGKQTMGVFISINGWSSHVVDLLKQNPEKSIFLMSGYDLRLALTKQVDLIRMLHIKLSKLNLEAEPFVGAESMLSE